MRNHQVRLFVLSAVTMIVCSSAWAQFDVSWNTVNGGGATSSGAGFELYGVIAQPDAQVPPLMSGGAFQVAGGFLPVTQVCYCPGDLNADGKRDGLDIQQFVSCFTGGGNCSCADVDLANGISLADVPVFVNNILASSTCP